MSLGHGGTIVRDGLVFSYDMGSKQSFRGAPTNNVIATSGLDCSLERSGQAPTYAFVSQNITSQVLSAWTASNNKFSMSFEGYREYVGGGSGGGADGYPVMYIYFTDWSWSSTISSTSYEWSYSKGENRTMPDPTGKTIYFSCYHMNSGNRGKSYGRNFQIEFNSFATPFVNGSRSTTDCLKDIIGGNSITANSLVYNSGDTFSFSGSSSISVPALQFPNGQTIEIWLKPTENDSARRNPYNQAYGGYGTWTHEPNGTINYYYGDGAGNASPYVGHTSSFTVGQNELACVCTTRGLTNSVWYKNGTRYNQYDHPYSSLTAHTSSISIGTGYAGAYIGEIIAVKLYDRQLSDAEVQQNFNALRGRFGI